MNRADLECLSKEELIELVLRMQRPEKSSRTSSKPPSTDRKEKRENAKPGGAKPGHEGHSRELCETPDATEDHAPTHCARCGAAFGADATRELIGEYDEIELPPVRPFVRRHRRFAIRCSCCGGETKAALPAAATGTPFGPRIHALAIYLKTRHALSYERLQRLFLDLFGLGVSQGALMNMFSRTTAAFGEKRGQALAILRAAKFVASDETGMRIEGVNAFHWVFRCDEAVVHEADFTRSAEVVRRTMNGARPKVWISDRYSAQQRHAEANQTCLAHLSRDVAYGIEASEDDAPFRLKLWFDRVFSLADEITAIAPSTLKAKRRELERQIDVILQTPTSCMVAAELIAKIARARDQLLTFCAFPGKVDPTNNACERALRPAVIQRKVTNGYRAMWAAEYEAAVRTVVDTAGLKGAAPFHAILQTIAA
jgi:transposase